MADIHALEADLSTYTVDVLLRAAFSLTHQLHSADKNNPSPAGRNARAKRDLIVAEIKRRCGDE